MGRVPNKENEFTYLIVGNGRLAKHLRSYFKTKNKKFFNWQRNIGISFESTAAHSNIILLAIKDDALHEFIDQNYTDDLNEKIWLHFSGSNVFDNVIGMHPLMTFTHELYSTEIYEKIPFVIDREDFDFDYYFDGLPNPNYNINQDEKALYHAYCSMAGNYTTILWQRFFQVMNSKFKINKEDTLPYMQRILENLINSDDPLTGPLKRGDTKTIEKHLESLNNDPFKEIYKSFVNAYAKSETKGE